jgi:hypothetical protein
MILKFKLINTENKNSSHVAKICLGEVCVSVVCGVWCVWCVWCRFLCGVCGVWCVVCGVCGVWCVVC